MVISTRIKFLALMAYINLLDKYYENRCVIINAEKFKYSMVWDDRWRALVGTVRDFRVP